MAIRAIVFDIGGVLERTPCTGWQRRWEDRLGLEPEQIDVLLHEVYRAGTVGTITLVEAERQIATILTLDSRQLEALMDDLWKEYLGSLDVVLSEWFRALRPRYKTALLSNSWVGAREKEEALFGFASLCDAIVYSHEERIEKPEPRLYEIVCDRLGVRAEEVVFLDDRKVNVAAARDLGMHGVLFKGDTPEAIAEIELLLADVPIQKGDA